ncbi:MAG: hypothetical protein ACP5QI_06470 [Candidatus Bathyarchaeia archaeon]
MYELFSNPAVEAFGTALRFAVGKREYGGGEDYASLIEFEYAENMAQSIDVLKKFLRRYDAYTRRYERENPGKIAFRPNEGNLDELVKLANEHGVRNVCAAIISHALVRPYKEE